MYLERILTNARFSSPEGNFVDLCHRTNHLTRPSDLLNRHQSKCHAGHPLVPKKGQRQNRKPQAHLYELKDDQLQAQGQGKKRESEQLIEQHEFAHAHLQHTQQARSNEPTLDLSSIEAADDNLNDLTQAYLPQSQSFLNNSSSTQNNLSNVAMQTAAVWSTFFNNQSSVNDEEFKQIYESQLANAGVDSGSGGGGYLNAVPSAPSLNTQGLPHTPFEFKLPISPNHVGVRQDMSYPKSPLYGVDMQQLLSGFGMDDSSGSSDASSTHTTHSTHSTNTTNTNTKNDMSMQDLWSQYLSIPMSANMNQQSHQQQADESAEDEFAVAAAHKAVNDVSALKLNQPPGQKHKYKALHKQQQSLSDQYRLPLLSGPPCASKAAGEDLREYEKAVLSRQIPNLNLNTQFLRYKRGVSSGSGEDIKSFANIHTQPYAPAQSHSIKRDLSTPYQPDDSKRYAFSLPTPLSPPEPPTDINPRLNEQLALRI